MLRCQQALWVLYWSLVAVAWVFVNIVSAMASVAVGFLCMLFGVVRQVSQWRG